IPALNEAPNIAATIASLRRQQANEIIVVDGGSSDDTLAQAQGADMVLQGTRGRAAQMNLGAAHATGDLLLFLHAACTLEDGALCAVERVLAQRSVVAGCFRMRVTASGALFRCIDGCATARVGLTGIVYGDQGLFVRREMFDAVGGFPLVRLMED